MDLSQFAVDGLVVVAVFILVNLVIKPILEVWLIPTMAAHDPVIRGLAVVLGIGGIFLDHGVPTMGNGQGWISLIVSGILSGLAAIGLYHTATGSATPPQLNASAGEVAPFTSATFTLPEPQQHVVRVEIAQPAQVPSTPEARILDVAPLPKPSPPEPAASAATPAV